MAYQISTANWSRSFLQYFGQSSMDMEKYDFCLEEWKAAHEKRTMKNYVLAIAFFLAGLWAVAANSPFMAVLLIALAANFNRQSSDHILFAEVLNSQRLLATLMNSQRQEIAALRADVKSGCGTPTALTLRE